MKMIHNGIEYADMQVLAEAYEILKVIGKQSNEEMSKTFSGWNEGRLQSYLVEITAKILVQPDDKQKETYLIDAIMDASGQKGTGKWSVQEAANVGIAAPCISAALEARFNSALKDLRGRCESLYSPLIGEVRI